MVAGCERTGVKAAACDNRDDPTSCFDTTDRESSGCEMYRSEATGIELTSPKPKSLGAIGIGVIGPWAPLSFGFGVIGVAGSST